MNAPLIAPISRNFAATIGTLRYGQAATEIDDALRQLVQQVRETGRGGQLKLTLTVKPSKAGALDIHDEVAVKLPKRERPSTLLYATEEGHLQRNDPRQTEIPGLQQVDKASGEIVAVSKAG